MSMRKGKGNGTPRPKKGKRKQPRTFTKKDGRK